jgi:hypothetical protein
VGRHQRHRPPDDHTHDERLTVHRRRPGDRADRLAAASPAQLSTCAARTRRHARIVRTAGSSSTLKRSKKSARPDRATLRLHAMLAGGARPRRKRPSHTPPPERRVVTARPQPAPGQTERPPRFAPADPDAPTAPATSSRRRDAPRRSMLQACSVRGQPERSPALGAPHFAARGRREAAGSAHRARRQRRRCVASDIARPRRARTVSAWARQRVHHGHGDVAAALLILRPAGERSARRSAARVGVPQRGVPGVRPSG